jgi:hypothetical protein
MMKRVLFIAILISLTILVSVFAENEKPVVKEPIPPVNIDKTENVEEVDAVVAAETGANPPADADQIKTGGADDKPGKPPTPKRKEIDTNYDGRVDRIEMYDSEGRLVRVDVDTDYDGIFEEWIVYENGKPKMKGVDRNKDGRTDTWIEY